MFGFPTGRGIEAIFFLFLHPVYLASLLTLPLWPVTFLALAWRSPHRRRIRWWFFMPVASLAGSVVSTLQAGFLLWIPALFFFRLKLPPDDGTSLSTLYYAIVGGAVSALCSVAFTRKLDRRLHEDMGDEK